ncbi:hypothetical protein DNF23_53200 [Pseudomonas syringae pv. pisi]
MSAHAGERFDRRTLTIAAPVIGMWPSADPSHLSETQRNGFDRLCQALAELFSQADTPITEILARYGIGRSTLYRAARRCLANHSDGRIYGFRAALPFLRIKRYERQIPVEPAPYQRSGCAGAFTLLLRDYPGIEQTIRRAVRRRHKKVVPGGQVRQPIYDIHLDFIAACRAAGITAERYPFNTKRLGFRSLHAFVLQISQKDFAMAVSHSRGTEVA